MTPLSSQVETDISWSPLSGLQGAKLPVDFGERTRYCSPGHAEKEGPHLAMTGASRGFSRADKESVCNAGDPGSIPESGRFPEEEHSNPLQYSCLENPGTEKPDSMHVARQIASLLSSHGRD